MAGAMPSGFAAQVEWGRAYIAETYGSSSSAWHNESTGWYERGAPPEKESDHDGQDS